MKILLLCQHFPSPFIAHAQRVFYALKYFKKCKYDITLLAFTRKGEEHPYNLKEWCKKIEIINIPFLKNPRSFNGMKYAIKNTLSFQNLLSKNPYFLDLNYWPKMQQKLQELLKVEKYDLVFVDSIGMSFYVLDKNTLDIPKILESWVASGSRYHRYKVEKNILKKIFSFFQYYKVRRYESKYKKFDMLVTVSQDDAYELRSISPSSNISVIPYGVDFDYFKPIISKQNSFNLVFLGDMSILHNIDAVLYFYHKIFPLIKEKFPNVVFYIVGRRPSKKIMQLKYDSSVIVTGYVEDVRPHLANATIVIVPEIGETGIEVKILEAMAMGKSIVSTSIGVRGINVTSEENIIIADNPKEFARRVIELLSDKELREKIGINARKLIEEEYSWENMTDMLNDVFKKVANADESNNSNCRESIINTPISSTKHVHIDDLDFVVKSLREYFDTTNLKGLDFGCGSGNMITPLASLGYEMIGFDISQEKIKRAKSNSFSKDNPTFFVGDAENLGISEKEIFDFIICTEVLEHLKNPERALNSIGKVLKREGVLIVSVPNGFGPYSLICDQLRNKIVYKIFPKIGKSDHVQSFSLNGINRLLAKAGFNVVRAKNSDFLSFLPILGRSYWFCFYDRKLADKFPSIFASGYYLICKKCQP